jgi:anti-anti-sigma factor
MGYVQRMNVTGQTGPSMTVECANGTTSVLLAGEWDLCEAPRLREALDAVNASQHVVFDLAGITYVDSSTLRVFVEFKQRSKSLGGTTALYYGGNERARRLMSLSGIGTLLRDPN